MRRDPRAIEGTLLRNVADCLNVIKILAKAWPPANMPVESAGEESGCAMEIETAPAFVEVADAPVPDSPAWHAKKRPQLLPVDRDMLSDLSFPKHREELGVPQRPQGGNLELKESRLVRIQVDAVDALRTAEHIVESVAAGTGDHDDPIGCADIQCSLVNKGIFPALVVDEVSSVNLVEQPLVHSASIADIVTFV